MEWPMLKDKPLMLTILYWVLAITLWLLWAEL